jgi:ribose 5-phosphate isomerase B
MRIFFASDHAGFSLKEVLRAYVATLGHDVEDCGAYTYDEEDDYPDIIAGCMRRMQSAFSAESAKERDVRAIILGGSGQGEAIVANRFSGIRAVVYNGESVRALERELDEITLSREHNNANVLSLGARFLSEDEARHAVHKWLDTDFSHDPRHERRIERIDTLTF